MLCPGADLPPCPPLLHHWSPWGGRLVAHWRAAWSTFCSSAPHPQAAEEAIPPHSQTAEEAIPIRRNGGAWRGHCTEYMYSYITAWGNFKVRDAGERWNSGGVAACPLKSGSPGEEMPFHNRIIGSFMVYHDWLETSCGYSCTHKVQNVFL